MKRPPALKIEPNGFEQFTIENAQGVMISLSSAPTSTIPQLIEKQWGYYNNKVYFVIDGVLKEFAVSSTA